jgi:malonate transporter
MGSVLLDSLVPLFAVMALGYLAGWLRMIDSHNVSQLNVLVTDFALPASVFLATATTRWGLLVSQWRLLAALGISMVVLYFLVLLVQQRYFRVDAGVASVQALTIAQPNFAAAGLALVPEVFGSSDTFYVALSLAWSSILITPLTLGVLELRASSSVSQGRLRSLMRAVTRAVCKPIVLAPILGLVISFFDLSIPDSLRRTLTLLGNVGAGSALFLTGLVLAAQRVSLTKVVVAGALLKNLAHPLLVVVLLMLFSQTGSPARLAILLAALPCGFFGVLFAARYGVESESSGSILIVSSVLSAVTLAAALALTAHL